MQTERKWKLMNLICLSKDGAYVVSVYVYAWMHVCRVNLYNTIMHVKTTLGTRA
jgi:hypothetical protein